MITYPAPWGEIEIPGEIIYTVPSKNLQNLPNNISDAADVHLKMMKSIDKFAGLDKRFRVERLVVDVEISGGWLHSGYPIMGYVSITTDNILNATYMKTNGMWGFTHELGHNHQWNTWFTDATAETSCNWWSIAVNYNALGLKQAHEEVVPEVRLPRIHSWVMRGKPSNEWKVWLALDTYAILGELFTWDSYTTLIKQYYSLPDISDENQKYDLWARRYSQTVNRSLCSYFEWWGLPISAESKAICAKLPSLDKNPLAKFDDPKLTATCKAGWTAYGDSCYLASPDKTNWWDAKAKCQQLGANVHLASCMSAKEIYYLAYQLNSTTGENYFVGLSDIESFKNFSYLNGKRNHELSELLPKNLPNRHCVTFGGAQVPLPTLNILYLTEQYLKMIVNNLE